MRSVLFALLFAVLAIPCTHAADFEFVRVWPGWRSADSFERISEYFTNQENPGRQVIVRTQQNSRAGFYYLVRVLNRTADLIGAHFALQVVTPVSADIKTYTFPVNVPAKQTVFELGLTGTDWTGEDAHPVAWKLDLFAADGHVVASEQNFLWEKPAAK